MLKFHMHGHMTGGLFQGKVFFKDTEHIGFRNKV